MGTSNHTGIDCGSGRSLRSACPQDCSTDFRWTFILLECVPPRLLVDIHSIGVRSPKTSGGHSFYWSAFPQDFWWTFILLECVPPRLLVDIHSIGVPGTVDDLPRVCSLSMSRGLHSGFKDSRRLLDFTLDYELTSCCGLHLGLRIHAVFWTSHSTTS